MGGAEQATGVGKEKDPGNEVAVLGWPNVE